MQGQRDYSGVPTREVVAAYVRYSGLEDPMSQSAQQDFAEQIGMSARTLKDIIEERYAFTGISNADLIIEGLGQSLHVLEHHGEIHVVPARKSRNAAEMMALDFFYSVGLDDPSRKDIDDHIDDLLESRERYVVASSEQEERLRRESEIASKRNAAKRAREKMEATPEPLSA